MDTPPLPALQTRVFRDIDEQAACLAGYDQHYQQMGRGRFVGEFTTWRSAGGVAVHLEEINQTLHQRGHTPEDSHSVGLLMHSDDRCRFNGVECDRGSLIVLPPGTEYDASIVASTRFCVIQVPRSSIEAALQDAALDVPLPGLATRFMVKRPGERRMAMLRRQVHKAAGQADVGPREDAGRDRSLHDLLLRQTTELLAVPNPAGPGAEPPADRRLRAFRRACEFLHANVREPITMRQVCDAAAVSRRTLEYCFAEELGQSPAAYLRALRLNGIHRALQAGEAQIHSVGDIAARWGMWHPSRFAQTYRLMFDELPSQTAARAQG